MLPKNPVIPAAVIAIAEVNKARITATIAMKGPSINMIFKTPSPIEAKTACAIFDAEVVSSALGIIKKYHLAPRDAIHAATAIAEKADFIVSTDNHFDRIKELKRKSL